MMGAQRLFIAGGAAECLSLLPCSTFWKSFALEKALKCLNLGQPGLPNLQNIAQPRHDALHCAFNSALVNKGDKRGVEPC